MCKEAALACRDCAQGSGLGPGGTVRKEAALGLEGLLETTRSLRQNIWYPPMDNFVQYLWIE